MARRSRRALALRLRWALTDAPHSGMMVGWALGLELGWRVPNQRRIVTHQQPFYKGGEALSRTIPEQLRSCGAFWNPVCYPLQYPTRITIPVAWVMVMISWSMAALYSYGLVYSKANVEGLEEYSDSIYCMGSCTLLFNALWSVLDTLLTFFLPCSVMIGLYARIFVVAKKHIRTIGEANQHENENMFKTSRRSERKAAKTLGVVVGAFIICWLPFFINSLMDPYINFSTPFVLFDTFGWLGYINSTINPIIYGLFYPWFRKSLSLIITMRIFEPNSSDISVFTV
ncbi:trace amine-associated receptor 13c-like [Sinocyclocheilus rhinocerous]|uniref:trace amine-associated receptor 13c-like n=1 Tax=Sinocyclocheilus rhinocerous TaxID=307959 RepID=UPI0007BA4102|nr:PREDICTED: trace amine-associated receptor 13c-like [Sinocyclocheilus rhinocerous]